MQIGSEMELKLDPCLYKTLVEKTSLSSTILLPLSFSYFYTKILIQHFKDLIDFFQNYRDFFDTPLNFSGKVGPPPHNFLPLGKQPNLA